MHGLATHPDMQAALLAHVARKVAAAEDNAALDGAVLTFRENGMTNNTAYGQQVEDEAALDAERLFGRMLAAYSLEAAKFDPAGPYIDAIEHAGNEIHPQNEDEQEALDIICDVHYVILYPEDKRRAA